MKTGDYAKDHKRLVVYLPPAMHYQLRILTARRGTSMTEVTRDLLREYLKKEKNGRG